ncbi:MAG TPA: hypothetical protein ENJ44_05745 [Oceanospirillales bacterium]|nr:hypothetical protein [Oceanospirillales bacterium]
MNIFKAELKYYLRSPLIWLVAALFAFISAWSFLMAIEIFSRMQIKFAGMSDAPTISQGIIFPVIATIAKLSLLIVAIVGGLSFSRYQQNNGWSLIHAYQKSHFRFILQKFMADALVCLLFVLPAILSVIILAIMAKISLAAIFVAIIGLIFLLLWMLSLILFLSSLSNNSGFAILLGLVILVLLWSLSHSTLDASWGKNWLQVLSPQYHFLQFLGSSLSFASIFYFLSGILLMLWAISIRLTHKRMILS